MYGENVGEIRGELAALLRQHRIQHRLGSPEDRREVGTAIRAYRSTILRWCNQALASVEPLAFSYQRPLNSDPFRPEGHSGSVRPSTTTELIHALGVSTPNDVAAASLDQLLRPSANQVVEHWRRAARAASLAEHDTAPDAIAHMSAAQAHTVVGDVAAIAQALVILDRRYHVTPGWEDLDQGLRLGWAALAAAIDVNLGPPDYTIDKLGWRPATKPIAGPEKPGILGVLQAEHNLVVHMNVFPRATNLRFVIESQRFVSRRLLPFAQRIDPRVAQRWEQRAATYTQLREHFREIGGRIGHGALAAAEGGNAVRRLRMLPPETIIEPKVLAGFQVLFDRLDQRIADVVNEGIDRYAFFKRITLPELDLNSGKLVSPARIGFVPLDRASNKDLLRLVHHRLRPRIDLQPTYPGANRADFHAALTHRTPGSRAPDTPCL